MPEELRLEASGLRLSAKAWGPQGGDTWLCLHGWLDNAGSFDLLAPFFAEQRWVALDLPGHGLSEWRHLDADYLFVHWVPVVFEVAEALGWERFSIIGHSMGAAIGALCAGVFPERVRRLVAIDAVGPYTDDDSQAPMSLRAAVTHQLSFKTKRPPLPHADRAIAAKRLATAVAGLSESAARIIVERGVRDVEGGVVWRADPRLRFPSALRYTEKQVRAFLERIEAPTLFVLAEGGLLHEAPQFLERIASVPRASTVRLPGGHHLHLEDAPRVAQAIREFLATHSP